MKNMTLEHIAAACRGQYVGAEEWKTKEIAGAVTDSRQVEEGFLFLPLAGERVDGHDFIPSVFEKGALATLSERVLDACAGPYIRVDSCRQALQDLAAYYRSQLSIPIVGITGSVGKTSTKEMIASVLSTKYRVLRTEGNFNNEIGLPLTILGIRGEHEVAVVEMGISDFGEMHRLAAIARPDVGVVTNIGTCHLEKLGNRDGVLRAKAELFDHMERDAAVFLNGDDDKLRGVKGAGNRLDGAACVGERDDATAVSGVRILQDKLLFYGMDGNAACDIFMDGVEDLGLWGTKARLHTPAGDVDVEIPIPGRHNLYNAMAAAGVGLHLGLTLEEIQRGIAAVRTIAGRSNLIKSGGMLILDDCYNANPMSMRASLDVLKNGQGRTIAVLGDMGELGESEKQLHYEVGAYAAEAGIDVLFCVGTLARELERGAVEGTGKKKSKMQVFYYPTKEELLPHLLELVGEGDTILVKASHFMEFSRVVEALKGRSNGYAGTAVCPH